MTKPPLCVTPTSMPGVFVIRPRRFHDRRGFFFESYNKGALSDAGITVDFVQDNLSLSEPVYTLRGLHFQKEPFGQAKLVSVLAGAVLDVVVDLRKGSSCFGKHMSVTAQRGKRRPALRSCRICACLPHPSAEYVVLL